MKTLTELAPVLEQFGSSTRDASNWIARDKALAARLPKTIAGSAREFSRLDAIDLVSIAALVKGGAMPARAASYSAAMVRSVKATGKASREWIVFPCGRLKDAVGSDKPDPNEMVKHFGEVPLSFVPIGAVVRMVDKLFAEN